MKLGLCNERAKKCIENYHLWINNSFEAYGKFVARHPFIPLVVGIVLLGSLSVGLVKRRDETDVENLWVEQNSRVVEERHFFNSKFGGLPRKEGVLITSKDDAALNMRHAMDALTAAVAPLYDNLTMTSHGLQFTQRDFCERPMSIRSLKSGTDPWREENWIAWGYRKVFSYAMADHGFPNQTVIQPLPEDWGIDEFPCFKTSPMDCFREGGDFDYPESLQQIDQIIGPSNLTVPQVLFLFIDKYIPTLRGDLFSEFNQHSGSTEDTHQIEEVPRILERTLIISNVRGFSKLVSAWGYKWRKSYKEMTSGEIIDYMNDAIMTAKTANSDPLQPAAMSCIQERRSCCLSWFGVHSPIQATLGNVVQNASGTISSVGSIRWVANHFHANHPLWVKYIKERVNPTLSGEQRKHLILRWEGRLVEWLSPLRENMPNTTFGKGETSSGLQVQFSMWKSTEDVIKDANKTPKWELLLSVILVTTYSMFSFLNIKNPVHSHAMLVFMGMAVVGLSILAGFGLTAAVGISFTPLAASVVPFLALAIGIDDIFVLTTILRRFLKATDTECLSNSEVPVDVMRATVGLAGPSLILTTFSVLASFFISSVNPMPIVRWFCWQMGFTALVHTFGMLSIFIPIMSLDARRVKVKIVDPVLWLFSGMHAKNGVHNDNDQAALEKLHEQEQRSVLSKLISKYYVGLFSISSFKIGMIMVFLGLLGSTIYLGTRVEHGLKISEVTVKGSYQHDYAFVTEHQFPVYDIWIVTKSLNYPNSQRQLLGAYKALQDLDTWVVTQPKVLEISWLGNLYLAEMHNQIAPENFYSTIQKWSKTPYGTLSMQDLCCYHNKTSESMSCKMEDNMSTYKIGATKSLLFANNLGAEIKPNLEMIKQTRKALDNANKDYFNGTKLVYAYGYSFLFFEQYLHSTKDLLAVAGFALVGVFVAVLLFQCNFTIALLITAVLLMVDVEVFGFLYVIGAKLNSLSLVNLGIVIGMASEFTYLARTFLVVDGTRSERVGKALQLTFEPLLHGLGTQVAATFPLIFLKYHAVRQYYFAMFTLMGIIGFLNGFVLLPALLSIMGPSPVPYVKSIINRNGHEGSVNKSSNVACF